MDSGAEHHRAGASWGIGVHSLDRYDDRCFTEQDL